MPVAVPSEQTARPRFPRSIVVIPARFESTRFPGKALALIGERPMIEHVYRRARQCPVVDDVVVATDDRRILQAVEAFGGRAVLTSASHRSGTERLAEIAPSLDCELIVNVQGDEPLLDPRMIEEALAPLVADPALQMGTLRRAITDPREHASPDVVKVVVDRADYALYFSRAPIPFRRDAGARDARAFKHIGLYVYRREFLLALAALPATALEQCELLEQLRALEHGYRIKAVETAYDSVGVDTPDDLVRVRELLAKARAIGTASAP